METPSNFSAVTDSPLISWPATDLQEEVIKEVIKEVINEVTEEAIKKVIKEVIKKVIKEVTKEVTKEAVKEVTKEVTNLKVTVINKQPVLPYFGSIRYSKSSAFFFCSR